MQDPPYLFATPPPSACLRTQTSCIRVPNSILVFFHLLSQSDLSLFVPISVKFSRRIFASINSEKSLKSRSSVPI